MPSDAPLTKTSTEPAAAPGSTSITSFPVVPPTTSVVLLVLPAMSLISAGSFGSACSSIALTSTELVNETNPPSSSRTETVTV